MSSPQRVLIVRIGALGDAIHTLPLVHEIHKRAPDAEIDWAAGPGVARFLDGHTAVNRFILVKRGVRGFLTARAAVRGRYDTVFDTQGLMKSAVLARAAALPRESRVIGRARGYAREFPATWFYTDRVVPQGAHIIEQNLDLLTPLWPDTSDREVRYDIPTVPAPDWPLLEERPVLFNIGGGWWTKLWPLENFIRLARAIDEALGLRVGVVWGPGEERDAARIAAESPAEMAPPTSMRELASVFSRARLVVSGETGPLHLAVAVGCRTVALLGPTAAQRNGPYGAGHVSIEAGLPCGPCHARTCADWRCMPSLTVDRVLRAVADAAG